MDEIDCVVIGAGVVGLAVARALANDGREVLIVDKEALIGSGASSRNSEVIHAGIYYKPGSLKARLCVEGRARLYAYLGARGLPHRRCGKLIVAPSAAQTPELEAIRRSAEANGVEDLRWLSGKEARAMEPELRCDAALLSPSTGIIDSHAYMLALLGDAEAAGAVLALRTEVTALEPAADGVSLTFAGEAAPSLRAHLVVNSAGLDAPGLAATCMADRAPTAYFAKGSYFTLSGRAPFSHLIYPTPEPGGLGVHLTLDLAGQARFGPDVEWVDAPDYVVDPRRGERFYAAIRQYWPGLRDGALAPAYAGVRAKISAPGQPAEDFRISGPAEHGVAGLINLFGIESPGLTSSLAIGEAVASVAREQAPR
jgi:L-2-hydroxyglutarate oxidase LhgO